MKKSVLQEKSYTFAIRIVKLSKYLNEKHEYILSKQVLRSGTSIGAMVHEARYAESPADFVHKLSIGLKEAHETHYWLSLLKDTEYITQKMFDSIIGECEELITILTASIKTAKKQ
jgi:four helix bundle protein